MERLRSRKVRSACGGLFLLGVAGIVDSGCSFTSYGTQEVKTIYKCSGNQTPILATFLGSKDYKQITDPAYLAKQQENSNDPIGNTLPDGDILVGIGTVVCRADISGNTRYYITAIGAQEIATISK
jgi:hypothetical protein